MVEPHRARWLLADDARGGRRPCRSQLGHPHGAVSRVPALRGPCTPDLRLWWGLHLARRYRRLATIAHCAQSVAEHSERELQKSSGDALYHPAALVRLPMLLDPAPNGV